MDPRHPLRHCVWIIIACFLLSCQTFGAKKRIPKPLGTFKELNHRTYAMKIDLLSPEQSEEYFGVNLNEMGIQPINVELENKSHEPLQVTLEDIYLKDKDKYMYRPLTLRDLSKRIYEANKYKEMANYGAKSAAIGGAVGAIIGTVAGLIIGRDVGTAGAIGGWGGASAGAFKGASEAKGKATERIQDQLGPLMWLPGKIPSDVKVKGLMFFEVDPQEIKSLEVRLGDIETRAQESLELELEILK